MIRSAAARVLLALCPLILAAAWVEKGREPHYTLAIDFQVDEASNTGDPLYVGPCDTTSNHELHVASLGQSECEWPAGPVGVIREVGLIASVALDEATEVCDLGLQKNGVDEAWTALSTQAPLTGCAHSRLTGGQLKSKGDYCVKRSIHPTVLKAGDTYRIKAVGADCDRFMIGYFILRGDLVW